MRAVLPYSPETVGVPQLGDLPDPVAGRGEVLVEVAAAGLNRADLHQLRGEYPPPPGESEVPGLECAGTIIALGPDAGEWRVGERVMALLAGGGQGSRAAIPVGQLMRLGEHLSFAQGAAIPEAGLTAWTNLVVEGNLQSGQSVLVTGASGGIGSFAVQLARELGANVIAAARDRVRLERLADYGIRHVVTDDEGLVAEVGALTGGKGVDLVLDLVSGAGIAHHLDALRRGGRLVLLGVLGGSRAEVELGAFLSRRLRMVGSTLRPRPRSEKAVLVREFAAFSTSRLASGALRPIVDRVVALDDVGEGYRALADDSPFGKIVVSFS
jgi:putative PIG3 family NAD(P)H quinone oxidoreductase